MPYLDQTNFDLLWKRVEELNKEIEKLQDLAAKPRIFIQTQNPHLGSTLDSFLEEEGIKDEVDAAALEKTKGQDPVKDPSPVCDCELALDEYGACPKAYR